MMKRLLAIILLLPTLAYAGPVEYAINGTNGGTMFIAGPKGVATGGKVRMPIVPTGLEVNVLTDLSAITATPPLQVTGSLAGGSLSLNFDKSAIFQWANLHQFDAEAIFNSTLRLPGGTTLPTNCLKHDLFINDSGATGSRVYLCEADNTWVAQAGAAASGGAQNKFDATADPTVSDDSASGYSVGSRWINTTTGVQFICTDPANGTAVWKEVVVLTGSNLVLGAGQSLILDKTVLSDGGVDLGANAASALDQRIDFNSNGVAGSELRIISESGGEAYMMQNHASANLTHRVYGSGDFRVQTNGTSNRLSVDSAGKVTVHTGPLDIDAGGLDVTGNIVVADGVNTHYVGRAAGHGLVFDSTASYEPVLSSQGNANTVVDSNNDGSTVAFRVWDHSVGGTLLASFGDDVAQISPGGNGSILNLNSDGTATLTADGTDGVEMTTDGYLQSKGSGRIYASDVRGTEGLTIGAGGFVGINQNFGIQWPSAGTSVNISTANDFFVLLDNNNNTSAGDEFKIYDGGLVPDAADGNGHTAETIFSIGTGSGMSIKPDKTNGVTMTSAGVLSGLNAGSIVADRITFGTVADDDVACTNGDVQFDASYVYFCVDDSGAPKWKRIAMSGDTW